MKSDFSSLQQIVGLDEKNQILTTNIWSVHTYLMKYLETIKLICVSQISFSRLTMTWYDPFMRWNESEHNNINVSHLHFHNVFFLFMFFYTFSHSTKPQNIRISPDRLWKPDILLYNSASADFYGAYQR